MENQSYFINHTTLMVEKKIQSITPVVSSEAKS